MVKYIPGDIVFTINSGEFSYATNHSNIYPYLSNNLFKGDIMAGAPKTAASGLTADSDTVQAGMLLWQEIHNIPNTRADFLYLICTAPRYLLRSYTDLYPSSITSLGDWDFTPPNITDDVYGNISTALKNIALLKERGANITVHSRDEILLFASLAGDRDVVDFMLREGVTQEAKDMSLVNLVWHAPTYLLERYIAILPSSIESLNWHFKPSNITDEVYEDISTLLKNIALLKERGANIIVHSRDEILLFASLAGDRDVVDFMLREGVTQEAKNKAFNVSTYHLKEYLAEHGADTKASNLPHSNPFSVLLVEDEIPHLGEVAVSG